MTQSPSPGEGSGRDTNAEAGAEGGTVTPPSSPPCPPRGGRWPPARLGGGGGGQLSDICRFWGLRGLDVEGRGKGTTRHTVSPGLAGRAGTGMERAGPRVTPACSP